LRDLIELDPFGKKKPWNWLSGSDVFSLPLPTDLKKMDFRVPAISISEEPLAIRIHAELPGIDKKDLKVSLSDQSVSIRGNVRTAKTKSDHEVVYSEFSSQQFFRQVPLPHPVNAQKAKISFKNGLLEVLAPKSSSSNSPSKPKDVPKLR